MEQTHTHVIAVYFLAGQMPLRYTIMRVNNLTQTVFNQLHGSVEEPQYSSKQKQRKGRIKDRMT